MNANDEEMDAPGTTNLLYWINTSAPENIYWAYIAIIILGKVENN